MVAQVGYLVAGRSRGLVALCAVCTMHMETRSMSFLVEPQNQGRRFVSGLASKPLRRFSPVWPHNRWLGFPGLGLKTCSFGLMIWASKSPRRFLGLGPQNQAGHGLSVAPQNRRREDGARHASRSGGLLYLETSHARVSQSGLKTGRGATVGNAHGTITEVALGSS
jgi:hypothetical protein